MKFDNFKEALKNPDAVTEIELGTHALGMKYDDPGYDVNAVSDLLGDLSIFKNIEKLKLTAFPASEKLLSTIWGNKKIKELWFWNIELKQLPEGIKELPALEMLVLNYNPITTLPAWIGELQKLNDLSVYGCGSLTALPPELLLLKNLKTFAIGENYKLRSFPEGIEEFASKFDKHVQKEIKRLQKKIESDAVKKAGRVLDEYGQSISKFDNKPCTVTFDGEKRDAIVFDWKYLEDDEIKDFLNDELGDEMSENKGYIPLAILAYPDQTVEYKNNMEFFEQVDNPDAYLMANRKTGKLFRSAWGKLELTIKDLDIQLK